MKFGPRRGYVKDINDIIKEKGNPLNDNEIKILERLDLCYRTLCGILYNFVPTSGHPGGSISSGRMVECILYYTQKYDFKDPNKKDADIISYAAGHKAMGLYAMWALRNELMKIANPKELPSEKEQLRFEDLLGFRRNPTTKTPLFSKYKAKSLDGHPTPTTPFIKLSTGASGVGVSTSFGLALGALDSYGDNSPYVHIIEGEGGLTPGRVAEAMATAATAGIKNIVLHVDWNQASIDSNQVCRDEGKPGDYVQWDPVELAHFHDWNVVYVDDGFDFNKILAAQKYVLENENTQPSVIVYKTVKGWNYGIEGKASHGAGHKFCTDGFYNYLKEFEKEFKNKFTADTDSNDQIKRCSSEEVAGCTPEKAEKCFFKVLMHIRNVLEKNSDVAELAGLRLKESKNSLLELNRKKTSNCPDLNALYNSEISAHNIPEELKLSPGQKVTLRGALGDILNYLNKKTDGGFIGASADLLGSTSVTNINKGFPEGFYNYANNKESRLIATGGICEDAMGGIMAGLATFGNHIGVGSSYGAFIAALQHISARLHGIGQQAKKEAWGEDFNTFIMINAHAGIKTGEDGPTHADPQAMQLLVENFPKGVGITLDPWDPQEMWPLVIASLQKRPAILMPFVTRPAETVCDRNKLKLAPAIDSIKGVYAMRSADTKAKQYNGTIVLQESGVATTFFTEVLPKLDEKGLNLNIYYVASPELFDLLTDDEKQKIYPQKLANEAMGITGWTLPTMYRWVTSFEGRKRTLYPFKKGHYLGSGQAYKVLEEGGFDTEGQFKAVMDYAICVEKR